MLLLVFGHGDADTNGISIGGEGEPSDAPRLKVDSMKVATGYGTMAAIVLTSCFSGL